MAKYLPLGRADTEEVAPRLVGAGVQVFGGEHLVRREAAGLGHRVTVSCRKLGSSLSLCASTRMEKRRTVGPMIM